MTWYYKAWNPVVGCSPCSTGCINCVIHSRIKRYEREQGVKYNEIGLAFKQGFSKWTSNAEEPFYAICTQSDLFHPYVPTRYIDSVIDTVRQKRFKFAVITKRSKRLEKYFNDVDTPDNLAVGVSIENNAHTARAKRLKTVYAKVRIVVFEPLLERINNLENILKGIDWVIVGGETGKNKRSINISWVKDIYDVCQDMNIPFFYNKRACKWENCGTLHYRNFFAKYDICQFPSWFTEQEIFTIKGIV